MSRRVGDTCDREQHRQNQRQGGGDIEETADLQRERRSGLAKLSRGQRTMDERQSAGAKF